MFWGGGGERAPGLVPIAAVRGWWLPQRGQRRPVDGPPAAHRTVVEETGPSLGREGPVSSTTTPPHNPDITGARGCPPATPPRGTPRQGQHPPLSPPPLAAPPPDTRCGYWRADPPGAVAALVGRATIRGQHRMNVPPSEDNRPDTTKTPKLHSRVLGAYSRDRLSSARGRPRFGGPARAPEWPCASGVRRSTCTARRPGWCRARRRGPPAGAGGSAAADRLSEG